MIKPILIIKAEVRAEIYNKAYSQKDLTDLIALFNNIHKDMMFLSLELIKEEK